MLDIRFVCENPDLVKENIKKKFKDAKLPLVDGAIDLSQREAADKTRGKVIGANRIDISKKVGMLMGNDMKKAAG